MTASHPFQSNFNRLHNLLEALGDVSPPPPLPLSCEECEALLEVYVGEEVAGQPVQTLYPAIYSHLTHCAGCAADYALLKEEVQLASSSPLINDAPAWESREGVWEEGKQLRLSYWLNPLDLRQTLLDPPGVRRDPREVLTEQKHLLLNEEVVSDRAHPLEVDVVAIRHVKDVTTITIHATLSSPIPLPDAVRATLQWGEQLYQIPVNAQGVARFEGIPLAPLETEMPKEFILIFEV